MALERVATLAELPDESLTPVRLSSGERVCLVRKGNAVYAVSDVCTHEEFAMSDGYLVPGPGCTIECAWHGARFRCDTGAVLEPPATEPLPTFEVRLEHGGVFVGPRAS
jgi:3-phenylpropionate/trans-cinnamate dioxygenase ferredoxin subunit